MKYFRNGEMYSRFKLLCMHINVLFILILICYKLDFLLLQTFQTMVSDSSEKSHPISFELNNPSELTILFDAISYHKVSFKKNLKKILRNILQSNIFKGS